MSHLGHDTRSTAQVHGCIFVFWNIAMAIVHACILVIIRACKVHASCMYCGHRNQHGELRRNIGVLRRTNGERRKKWAALMEH